MNCEEDDLTVTERVPLIAERSLNSWTAEPILDSLPSATDDPGRGTSSVGEFLLSGVPTTELFSVGTF